MRVEDRFLRIAASPDGRTIYLSENAPRIRADRRRERAGPLGRDMPRGRPGRQHRAHAGRDGESSCTEHGEDPGVVRLDARTGEVVWDDRRGPRAGGTGRRAVGDEGRPDARTAATSSTTDTHVFTLDPRPGRSSAPPRGPSRCRYTDLVRVWPDGRVSRDEPDDRRPGSSSTPATRSGDAPRSTASRSRSPRTARAWSLVREIDGGTDLRVAPGATTWARPRRGSGCRRSCAAPRGHRTGAGIAVTTDDGIQLLDPDTMRLGARSAGHSGEVIGRALRRARGRPGVDRGPGRHRRRLRPLRRRTHPSRRGPPTRAARRRLQRQPPSAGVYLDCPRGRPEHGLRHRPRDRAEPRRARPRLPGTTAGWAPGTQFQVISVAITPDGGQRLRGCRGVRAGPGAGHGPWRRGRLRHRHAATAGRHRPARGRSTASPSPPTGGVPSSTAARVCRRRPRVGDASSASRCRWSRCRPSTGPTGAEVSPDGRLAALARNDEVVLVDVATGGGRAARSRRTEADTRPGPRRGRPTPPTIVAGSDAGWLHVVSRGDPRAGRAPPAHHRRLGHRPRGQPRRADHGEHRQRRRRDPVGHRDLAPLRPAGHRRPAAGDG